MFVRQPQVPATRPLTRSLGFAAVAVPVSLVGHLMGGGCSPDGASVLLACTVTVVMHRLLVARRERSWAGLASWMAGSQLLLHLILAGSAPAPRAAVLPSLTIAGHDHLHAAVMGMPDRPEATPSLITMVAAHVMAAIVLGWFLRQGERALWSAARRACVPLSALQPWVRTPAMITCGLPALPGEGLVTRDVSSGQAQARILSRHGDHATAGRRRRGPPTSIAGPILAS
jgi:hypothetical protein